MAKLYFRYGAMGASKTANALMVRHNYKERGKTAVLCKPRIENRDGEEIIRSRVGLEAPCRMAEEFIDGLLEGTESPCDCVIIDEVQFLAPEYIEKLTKVVDGLNIPVICYGLKTDFQSRQFPGSARLFELADEVEEIATICWCGKKARFNARIVDGKVIREGPQVQLGGNESYIALCRRHYMSGELKPEKRKEENA